MEGLCGHGRHGPSGPRPRPRPAGISGEPEHRSGLPDRGLGQRRRLWAMALAIRQPAQRRRLQLLLPPPALHHDDHRSRKYHRDGLLRDRGGHREQSHLARAQPGDRRAAARPDDRAALSVQPQAQRRGHAGGSSLGECQSHRPDAEGRGRTAAFRGRRAHPFSGSSAGRWPERGRSRRLPLVLVERSRRGPRWRGSHGGRPALPAHAHRARRGGRHRPEGRAAGRAAQHRPAAPAGSALRPGGACHRARPPRPGRRPREAGGGDRPAALGPADLHLPTCERRSPPYWGRRRASRPSPRRSTKRASGR